MTDRIFSANEIGLYVGDIDGANGVFVWGVNPTTNYNDDGDFPNLYVSEWVGPSDIRNIFFSVDFSTMPTGETITAGGIYLYQTGHIDFDDGIPTPLLLRQSLRAFSQTQVTWNVYSTGNNYSAAGGAYNAADCDLSTSNHTSYTPSASNDGSYIFIPFSAAHISYLQTQYAAAGVAYFALTTGALGEKLEGTDFIANWGADGQRPAVLITSTAGGGTVVESTGAATGQTAVSGDAGPTQAREGEATGNTALVGDAAIVNAVDGAASGQTSISGEAAAIKTTVGVSAGNTAISGQTDEIHAGEGAATGSTAVSGVSGKIAAVEGAATGSTTVSGEADDLASPFTEAVGTSVGSTAVDGQAARVFASEGESTGSNVAAGVSGVTITSIGESTGQATVNGIGEDASAPVEPPTPAPYTRNDGTIEQNFVLDYGRKQSIKDNPFNPDNRKKRIATPRRKSKETKSPERFIIVESACKMQGSGSMIVYSAVSYMKDPSITGQLMRRQPAKTGRAMLNISGKKAIEQLQNLDNVDIYIYPKGAKKQ